MSECESFLTGRYVQFLHSVGRTAPSWTCLNRLSHGSTADLRDLASGHNAGQNDTGSAAVPALAGELLARSATTPPWPYCSGTSSSRRNLALSRRGVELAAL